MSSSAPPTLPARVLRGGHSGPLQVARFSPDGRYCLTAGQDRTVCLWNPYRADDAAADGGGGDDEAGAGAGAGSGGGGGGGGGPPGALLLKQYRGHGHDVCDVAVAPDASRFCSVGGDKCAIVWDVAQGRVLRKLNGHDQRLSSCCWAGADASVLLTGSDDKTVRRWDMRAQPRGGGGGGGGGSGGNTSVGPASCLQTLGADVFHDSVTRVLVAGGHSVLACAMDGRVAEFDLRSASRTVDELGCPVATMALSHDGNCLLLAAPAPAAAAAAGAADGGAPAARLVLTERGSGSVLAHYGGHRNGDYRLTPAFSPDDALVVCGSEDGAVLFWDIVEATVVARLPDAHRRAVSCVDLARVPGGVPGGGGGGAAMLTASFDGTAKLWLPPPSSS